MGAGLQDPVVICWPFVIGKSETVAQKLMKLLLDVNEATCPAVAFCWPSDSKPLAMTEDSSVKEL